MYVRIDRFCKTTSPPVPFGTVGQKGSPTSDTESPKYVLDLVLSDKEGVINAVRLEGRLGKSDHEMISFNIFIEPKRANDKRERLNYARANYKEMRRTLEEEGWGEMEGKEVEETWQMIKGKIRSKIEQFTPRASNNNNKRDPPWFNKEIRKKIEKKKVAWKKWKETRRETDKE